MVFVVPTSGMFVPGSVVSTVLPVGGELPDGTLEPLQLDPLGSLLGRFDQGHQDAFGRARVGQPAIQFEAKLQFDAAPLLFDQLLVAGGTATHVPAAASVDLSIPAAGAPRVVRQSFQYVPYQTGRGAFVILTGSFQAVTTNVVGLIGVGDDDNGLFFRQGPTGVGVLRRSNTSGAPVDVVTAQASWNLDPLDGTGPSGFTLAPAAMNAWVIDYAWLGIGRIRFGVLVGNDVVYCHQVDLAGTIQAPWARTGSLPVRYELASSGVPAAIATLRQTCAAVFSEAGQDPNGIVRSAGTVDVSLTAVAVPANTRRVLCAVQATPAAVRTLLQSVSFAVLATTADNFLAELYVGGTLGGAVTTTAIPSSAAQLLTGAALTLTGGAKVATELGSSQVRTTTPSVRGTLPVGSTIAGVGQILSLVVAPFAAAQFHGALTWREAP